jgi:putative Mg2+ transporter-C (MgtC) family protein
VVGLTSAATVWFVSAIGLVVGYGNYALAGIAAVLTITTLSGLNRLEKRIEASRQLHIVRMHIIGPNLGHVRDVLVENRVTPDEIEVKRTDTGVAIDVEYVGLNRKHLALVHALKEIDGVEILLHY